MTEAWFLFLLAKMVTAALVVVGASAIAERRSPFVAAMVATLPISAGPVYVFLALEHDPAFIAKAALGSLGASVAAWAYCLVYVRLAQRQGATLSIGAALLAWSICVIAMKRADLPLAASLAVMLVAFAVCTVLTRPFRVARPLTPPARTWYVLPVRAGAVALLVAVVTSLAAHVGPVWSGLLATFPIVLSSLAAILHPRIGGPATAAAMANAVPGLLGLGLALALVHLIAEPLGSALALALGLGVCVLWNLGLILRSRAVRAA